MKRIFLRTLMAAALVLLVAVLVALLAGAVAKSELEALLEQARADGIPLELSDLKSYRPEGTVFYEGPPDQSVMAILSSDEMAVPNINIHGDGPWADTAPESGWFSSLTEDERAELMAQVKELATMPPTSAAMVLEVPVRKLSRAGSAAQLLVWDAYTAIEEGRADQALASCESAFRLANHLRDQPFLWAETNAVRIENRVSEFVVRIADDIEFSPDALRSLMEVLDHASPQTSLAAAYAGEFVLIRQYFGGDLWEEYMDLNGWVPPLAPIYAIYGHPLFTFWRASDEATHLRIMGDILRRARKPFWESTEGIESLLDNAKSQVGWRRPMSFMSATLLGGSCLWHAEGQAITRLTRAKLAIRLYRQTHNGLPPNLDALIPDALDTVPVDPFSGEHIRYVVDSDNYRLYSIGQNREDNGGEGKDLDPSAPDLVVTGGA